jgi:hypothetical protein
MCAFTLSGVIGFGGNLFAMPILSLFFNVKDLVLMFAAISVANCFMRTMIYRRYIPLKRFFPLCAIMLVGTLVGLKIYHTLPENTLKLILGIFVIIMVIYNNLHKTSSILAPGESDPSLRTSIFYRLLIFLAGIVQGAFVCGGVLLVIPLDHYFGYKREVYLSMQWPMMLCCSVILIAINISKGVYHGTILTMSLCGVLALFGTLFLSPLISKRLDDKAFHTVINAMLLLSGLNLSVQALLKILS